jgi:site-specific DNA-methyltransferase (adenine-specific)
MVVDPPYNLSKIYGNTKFRKAKKESYVDWFESWIDEAKRCLKPNASLYVCSDWQTSSLIQPILAKNFKIRNRITWEREKGRGAKSNWKNCSEDIWFCTVSDDFYFDVDAVKLRKKVVAPYRNKEGDPKDWEQTKDGNFRSTYPSNLWTDITLPFWSMPENTDHPTQKPEKLVAKLVLASSRIGDLVFDPFMGSGTTCVVAKKLDRRFLGIERESDYCAFALKRLGVASRNAAIQGYSQGYFWERNSLIEQNQANKAKSKKASQSEIHFGI